MTALGAPWGWRSERSVRSSLRAPSWASAIRSQCRRALCSFSSWCSPRSPAAGRPAPSVRALPRSRSTSSTPSRTCRSRSTLGTTRSPRPAPPRRDLRRSARGPGRCPRPRARAARSIAYTASPNSGAASGEDVLLSAERAGRSARSPAVPVRGTPSLRSLATVERNGTVTGTTVRHCRGELELLRGRRAPSRWGQQIGRFVLEPNPVPASRSSEWSRWRSPTKSVRHSRRRECAAMGRKQHVKILDAGDERL